MRVTRSIVHLCDYGGPYPGNFIPSLRALGTAMAEFGYKQVYVFSDIAQRRKWAKDLHDAGIPIHFLPLKRPLLSTVRSIAAIIDSEKPEILHTHFTSFDVSTWLAACLCRLTHDGDIRIVWHEHTGCEVGNSIKRRSKDFIKYRVMGRTVHVVACSEAVREMLTRRGCPRRALSVVPNAIDTARLAAGPELRAAARRQLGISEDSIVILAFGWTPVTKGIDLLTGAVERVVADDPRVMLLLIGEEQLVDFLNDELGIRWPNWLRVQEPVDDVMELYAAADIFASPSRIEGFPYSVLEALSVGLPVILSDIPSQTWGRGAAGATFFEARNVSSLEQAVRIVMRLDPEVRQRNGQASARFVSEHYSVHEWVRQLCDIYGLRFGRVGLSCTAAEGR